MIFLDVDGKLVLPPHISPRWWGVLARLEALKEMRAAQVDIDAARRERTDIFMEQIEFFLPHWDEIGQANQALLVEGLERCTT
jgi:hypothetical protein